MILKLPALFIASYILISLLQLIASIDGIMHFFGLPVLRRCCWFLSRPSGLWPAFTARLLYGTGHRFWPCCCFSGRIWFICCYFYSERRPLLFFGKKLSGLFTFPALLNHGRGTLNPNSALKKITAPIRLNRRPWLNINATNNVIKTRAEFLPDDPKCRWLP